MTYKFLILDTIHPDTLYLREQGCKDSWFFGKVKGVREQKSLGTTTLDYYMINLSSRKCCVIYVGKYTISGPLISLFTHFCSSEPMQNSFPRFLNMALQSRV
jgi:hypothetical protein